MSILRYTLPQINPAISEVGITEVGQIVWHDDNAYRVKGFNTAHGLIFLEELGNGWKRQGMDAPSTTVCSLNTIENLTLKRMKFLLEQQLKSTDLHRRRRTFLREQYKVVCNEK